MLFTLDFWKAAGSRALWTFAQTLGSIIGLTGVGVTIPSVDWKTDLYIAAVAALLSLLKSVSSLYPVISQTASAPAEPKVYAAAPELDLPAAPASTFPREAVAAVAPFPTPAAVERVG